MDFQLISVIPLAVITVMSALGFLYFTKYHKGDNVYAFNILTTVSFIIISFLATAGGVNAKSEGNLNIFSFLSNWILPISFVLATLFIFIVLGETLVKYRIKSKAFMIRFIPIISVYLVIAFLFSMQYNLIAFSGESSVKKNMEDMYKTTTFKISGFISENQKLQNRLENMFKSYQSQLVNFDEDESYFPNASSEEHLSKLLSYNKTQTKIIKEVQTLDINLIDKTKKEFSSINNLIYARAEYNSLKEWKRAFDNQLTTIKSDITDKIMTQRKNLFNIIESSLNRTKMSIKELENIDKLNPPAKTHIQTLNSNLSTLESLKTNYFVSEDYFKDTIETYSIEDVVWHEKYSSSILIASAILIDVVPIVILLIFLYYRNEKRENN